MLLTAATVLFPFVETTLHVVLGKEFYTWRIWRTKNIAGKNTSRNTPDDVMLWLNLAG